MKDRVRAAVDSGAAPPRPRDSATVMLIRGSSGSGGTRLAGQTPYGTRLAGQTPYGSGLEVYMLRRRQSMSFAPGAYVYPGGSVDSRDTDAEVAWAGPDVTAWAGWLGCGAELARGLLCAAVRETFEESGVLLAGLSADDAGVPDAADLEPDRLALLDRSVSLAGLLARRGLVLRSDLLKPWARWITPELESKRFDTRFFAAALPAGQQTWEIREEADEVAWLRPADVLAAAGRGEVALMPPTAVTVAELAACGDVATVLASPRQITPLRPQITLEDGQAWLHMPPGLEYPI